MTLQVIHSVAFPQHLTRSRASSVGQDMSLPQVECFLVAQVVKIVRVDGRQPEHIVELVELGRHFEADFVLDQRLSFVLAPDIRYACHRDSQISEFDVVMRDIVSFALVD